MKPMSSVERVTTVLDGGIPDRVPVGLHNFLMACHMVSLPFDEMTQNGEALAEAQLLAWREFRHDVIMHENGVCAEAEAFGAKVHYQPDQPPYIAEPLIKSLSDIDTLRVPDPETTYPLNELIRGTRIIARETNGRAFINGRSDQGPIALACALCGPEQFLIRLTNPDLGPWVNHLLDLCSQMNISLGKAQCRAGAHCSTIGLAGTSLISPLLFDQFEAPRAAAFCTALNAMGCYGFTHTCGKETHLIESLISTGADALELDPGTDPVLCKAAIQGRATIFGMLDPAHILASGLTDKVRQHVLDTLDIMAPRGCFIIGPGCALPADTKAENIHVLMETVRENGNYYNNDI